MTIAELKAQRRWVLHRDKQPYMPTGRRAKSNDPATWQTFTTCAAVAVQFSGLGVALGNGISGADLDDVLVNGQIIPEAQEIVSALNSYTEITPSGEGLHTLCLATLPGPGVRRSLGKASAIEIKADGFYFTYTGHHLEGTPLELMSRQAEIEVLYRRFHSPVMKVVGDGIPRPEAVQKFIRRFTAYADGLGATILAIKTTGNKTLILTSPCLLHDDHEGGVGITADGIRCVQCFHNRCAIGWARWSRLVEEKYGELMRLDGAIKWKR